MEFIDANIFLRYIVAADLAKAKACQTLFKQAQTKKRLLITSEAIIAEVVFVLGSNKQYGLAREKIQERLLPLLSLPGLKLPHRESFFRALQYFVQYPRMDFEDCLTVAQMERENLQTLYSYDRDFDDLDHIKRIEPAQLGI